MSNVNILTQSELIFFQILFGISVNRQIFPSLSKAELLPVTAGGEKKSPICTKAGFKPFTVSLSLDYIFYPLIILHIVAGLQF